MQPQQIPDALLSLLNVPDLVILAVVLVNLILVSGAAHSPRSQVLWAAASRWPGRTFSPVSWRHLLRNGLAEPIVRSVFEHKLKQSGVPDALADSVQTALRAAVQSMAESISYLVLIAVFSVLLSVLISLAVRALRLLSRVTPLGILDALAGGAIGLATGLLLVVLVLLGAHWFYPVTFTELGYLFTRTYRKYVPVS